MRIQCIGAKSYDSSQNESLGILVRCGRGTILIECGPYTVRDLKNSKISLQSIDAVFISHEHADHCSGLPWLMQSVVWDDYLKLEPRTKNLFLISGNGSIGRLSSWIRENWRFYFDANKKFRFKEVILGSQSRRICGASLQCFPLSHSIINYGLTVIYRKKKMCYVSDTRIEKRADLVKYLKGAAVVIFAIGGSSRISDECRDYGFCTAGEAAEIANEAGVGHLLLFHCFSDSEIQPALAEARKHVPHVGMLQRGLALQI